jgi:hypothetical protein
MTHTLRRWWKAFLAYGNEPMREPPPFTDYAAWAQRRRDEKMIREIKEMHELLKQMRGEAK